MNYWYYIKDGQQHGPIGEEEFKSNFKTGEITTDTLVWTNELKDWATAGEIKNCVPIEFMPPPPPIQPPSLHTTTKAPASITEHKLSVTQAHSAIVKPAPLVASSSNSNRLVVAAYIFSGLSIIPILGYLTGLIGFILGIILCAKNQAKHGAINITLSILFALVIPLIMFAFLSALGPQLNDLF